MASAPSGDTSPVGAVTGTWARPRFVLRREREKDRIAAGGAPVGLASSATGGSSGSPTSSPRSASDSSTTVGLGASGSGAPGAGSRSRLRNTPIARWPGPKPLLRAIWFAEFDNKVGPKITYQAPKAFLTPECFDEVSDFMITSPELCHKLITVYDCSPSSVCGSHALIWLERC